MRYVLRVSLPDRPGALGEVASAVGQAGIDIVSLDVIDRTDGVAIDEIRVDGDVAADRIRVVFEQSAGVVVEALDPVRIAHADQSPTALAAALTERPDDALQCLVDGLPSALGATWAVAVTDGPHGLEVLAGSAGAPDVPAGLRLPFLPLNRTRRLPQARWMPDAWRTSGRVEIAAASLQAPYAAVLLGREGGPRFRDAEMRRLWELARVAVAAAAPPTTQHLAAH